MNTNYHDDAPIDEVNGYIRQCIQLSTKEKVIPLGIIDLCLHFYWIAEYFTCEAPEIWLEKDDTIADYCNIDKKQFEEPDNIDWIHSTIYGNITIDNKKNLIYKWKFKLIIELELDGVGFGIDASNKQFSTKDYSDDKNKYPYYCFMDGKSLRSHNKKHINNKNKKYLEKIFSQQFKKNTIIDMILNIKNKTIKYYLNGKDLGIVFKEIEFNDDTKYHMAVAMDAYNEIKLVSFECKSNNSPSI